MPNWMVEDRLTTRLEGAREAHVHVEAGEVSVTAGDCPSSLDVERVSGDPIAVDLTDGVLQVRYDRSSRWGCTRNRALVGLVVPAGTDVVVGSTSASVVIGGLGGDTSVRTLSGDVVLDRVGGGARVRSASGDLEAREPSGTLRYETVSGDLTVVAGSVSGLSARTVSGHVLADLEARVGGEYEVATISGRVVVRVGGDGGMRVDARSLSGRIKTGLAEHDDDAVADLSVRTVSGDISVLQPVGVAG